jgi:signal transduction histidine kinase
MIDKEENPSELFKLNEKLKEKTIALENANLELKLSAERKREFMLITAHQLRSPIAAIQLMLKVISEGYTKGNYAQQAEIIQRAINRCDQLIEMVNELVK